MKIPVMSRLGAALTYVARSWPVFPVYSVREGRCACGNPECKHPGKHPLGRLAPHGPHSATTDAQTIRAWWTDEPDANIGIATGSRSGLVVLDDDPRHGGDKSLAALEAEHGPLPPTVVARTGGDGHHYLFQHPDNGLVIRNATDLGGHRGLDVRGDGGYIIAAPSVHITGPEYEWEPSAHPIHTPIAPLPDWLQTLMRSPGEVSPESRGEEIRDWLALLQGVQEGERHDVAVRIAGHYLGLGWKREEVEALLVGFAAQCSPPHNPDDVRRVVRDLAARDGGTDGGGRSRNHADRLIALAEEEGVALFYTGLAEPFAHIPVGGHSETWPLRSQQVRRWLARLLWDRVGKAPTSESLRSALSVLEARALFEGNQEPVHLRTAWSDGALYYDLSDAEWRAVKITGQRWEIVSDPPVRFRRYGHMTAQREPQRGGDIEQLWRFANITTGRDRRLAKRALVVSLIPDIPRPIIAFNGEQGSAKTFTARMLSALIDPSSAPFLRARDEAELVQGLAHHYAAVLDNLSFVPDWQSDLLCRAVTGEGFTKRQLYTDEEDVVFAFRRLAFLTGIGLVITKSDALDRSLLITLDPVPPNRRKEERQLLAEFETERPRIFGALLDHLVGAIRAYPNVTLPTLPRLADFARWAAAVDIGQGGSADDFVSDFDDNIARQHEAALAGSPLAAILLSFLGHRSEWGGSAERLLTGLHDDAKFRETPKPMIAKLPGSASILSRQLGELQPSLRALGWEIVWSRGHHPRTLTFSRRCVENTVPVVLTSLRSPDQGGTEGCARDTTRTGSGLGSDVVPSDRPSDLTAGDGRDGGDGTLRQPQGQSTSSPSPARQKMPVRELEPQAPVSRKQPVREL